MRLHERKENVREPPKLHTKNLTTLYILLIMNGWLFTCWRQEMIFWRGWGILVLCVWVVWICISVGIMISAGSYEPDEVKAAADTDRLFALSLILSAATVFFLARYREKRPGKFVDPGTFQDHLVPHTDEFMFVPMKYWTHILAAFSVGMFIKSFFE